jgi:probable F420-dependent oxidoreductase
VKFITSLAFSDPAQILPLARACDAAGFDAVAVSDHLIHPERIDTPYPYTADGSPRWEPFTAWPDPWVTAGYVAAATERLRVVTSIYVLPMRNPVMAAKVIGTAAVLSGGRVALGLGVGWMREEFQAAEAPFERRGARTDEMIAVLRKLWAGGWVEHHGEFYDFPRLEMSPSPGDVPIYGGGLSAPAFRRAAHHCDGWISDLHTTAELADMVARLRTLRADGPRADRPFAVLASVLDAVKPDDYRRLEAIGVTHVQTMPWIFYGGATEDLQQRVDGVRRFGDEVAGPLAGS